MSQSNNMHMNPGVNPNSDLFMRNENLSQQYREGNDSIITPKSANMNVKCVPDMMSIGMGVGGHGHTMNTKDNYMSAQDAIMHLNTEPNQPLNECDGMPLNANTTIQHSAKHSMNQLGSVDQYQNLHDNSKKLSLHSQQMSDMIKNKKNVFDTSN